MEKAKWLISLLGGILTVFTSKYALIIIFTTIVIAMDFVTGIIKAKATGQAISSKKGTKGFWKKIALLMALFFGFFLDYFIAFVLQNLNITLPYSSAIFGMVIGCYIIVNELISIAENLYRVVPDIFPQWIVKMLTSTKNQINDLGKDKEDE